MELAKLSPAEPRGPGRGGVRRHPSPLRYHLWSLNRGTPSGISHLFQFLQDCELLPVHADQEFDLFFGFQVCFVIVLGHDCGNGVLSFGGNEEDGTLKAGEHGKKKVQQNIGVGVPGSGLERPGVDGGPDHHEDDEAAHKGPASHPVPHDVSGPLALSQGSFMSVVPGL